MLDQQNVKAFQECYAAYGRKDLDCFECAPRGGNGIGIGIGIGGQPGATLMGKRGHAALQGAKGAKIACSSLAPMAGDSPPSASSRPCASSPLRRCMSWIFSSSVPRAINL